MTASDVNFISDYDKRGRYRAILVRKVHLSLFYFIYITLLVAKKEKKIQCPLPATSEQLPYCFFFIVLCSLHRLWKVLFPGKTDEK